MIYKKRYGTYTDDTNCTLALAESLVEKGKLDPEHIATNYCVFWKQSPHRGYPYSAQNVCPVGDIFELC